MKKPKIEFCNDCQMWFRVKKYGREVGILDMVDWDLTEEELKRCGGRFYTGNFPPGVKDEDVRVFEDTNGVYHRCQNNKSMCVPKTPKQKLLKKLTLRNMKNSPAFVSKLWVAKYMILNSQMKTINIVLWTILIILFIPLIPLMFFILPILISFTIYMLIYNKLFCKEWKNY